jgi:hypothetical protein
MQSLLQTQRFPGGRGTQISKQSKYEGAKVVGPTHWPPLPADNFLGTIFF